MRNYQFKEIDIPRLIFTSQKQFASKHKSFLCKHHYTHEVCTRSARSFDSNSHRGAKRWPNGYHIISGQQERLINPLSQTSVFSRTRHTEFSGAICRIPMPYIHANFTIGYFEDRLGSPRLVYSHTGIPCQMTALTSEKNTQHFELTNVI